MAGCQGRGQVRFGLQWMRQHLRVPGRLCNGLRRLPNEVLWPHLICRMAIAKHVELKIISIQIGRFEYANGFKISMVLFPAVNSSNQKHFETL